MPGVSLVVLGVDEAFDLADRLDKAGDGRLQRRLADAVYEAHTGIGAVLRHGALDTLPTRGGLAAAIARAHFKVNRTHLGVDVSADHEYDLRGIDHGLVIHPLFGNPRHWYTQGVQPGWFTHSMEQHQHTTTRQYVARAVEAYAKEIEG